MRLSASTTKALLFGVAAVSVTQVFASETIDSVMRPGEVVVTGSAAPVADNLLPYSVSVVGHDRLESTGQTQVLSAISGLVPSLFVTERGIFGFGVSNGGSGHIKLRGVGGDRASAVLMMVDGQPQFAGIYSHHIADFYDKENVERVEVLRGPGSVLYGSNAMAGAINVITAKPRARGVTTVLTSQFGSCNTWLSSLTNTVRFGKFSSMVSASYNRTDGNVRNFDFRQADGYAKVGYEISSAWRADADFTLMHFVGNDPIFPRLFDPESTDIYHQNVTRGDFSVSASNFYGATGGYVKAYFSYGNHFIDDPRRFHSKDSRFGMIVNQNFRPWSGASASAGLDFDLYSGEIPVSGGQNHTDGSLMTIGRKKIAELSPYLTLLQSLAGDIVSLSGGLRLATSDRFRTQWVPQFGLAVNPGQQITIKATAAMGYRNPSFRELYLYRMANPDLQPEKMWNYELSLGKSFSRYLTAEITAYYSRGRNMIQTVDMKNENTGRFINKGLEFSAKSAPFDNLRLYATYSFLATDLRNLTGAPENQYYLGADLTLWKKLKVALSMKGVTGLFVAEGIRRQNYALLNTKITYSVASWLDLFVRLENMTSARYEINRGYEMPGFTALGGFRMRLSVE